MQSQFGTAHAPFITVSNIAWIAVGQFTSKKFASSPRRSVTSLEARLPICAEVIERYPKSVREQFPGRAVYRVRPIPEGELPAFVFIVALVCYPPASDTAADFSNCS